MQEQLNPEEINKLVNKTIDLQNQAESALKQVRTMRVFDPRNEADLTSSENAVVWTSKSIELAYEAIKQGYGLRKNPFLRGNIDIRKPNLTFQYTEEEIAEIIRCKKDIIYFANKYVYLKTATGRRQIKLRPYQVKLLENLQNFRFNVLLQSRQTGKCLNFVNSLHLKKDGTIFDCSIGKLFYNYSTKFSIRNFLIRKLWKLYSLL